MLTQSESNDYIKNTILSDKILSAGKIGNSERIGLIQCSQNALDDYGTENLHYNAGVYPPSPNSLYSFCSEYVNSIQKINVFAQWIADGLGGFAEAPIIDQLAPDSERIHSRALEPFYHEDPWSSALKGKRVLVISPFEKSIKKQYEKREDLWENKNILPEFELLTLRTPMSAGISDPEFETWFTALDYFKEQIKEKQPEFVIVGAGAWSLPIVAYCSDLGIDALHMGGGTQILFGIKGKRWDDHDVISTFYNEEWVRPSGDEVPQRMNNMRIDTGHYW